MITPDEMQRKMDKLDLDKFDEFDFIHSHKMQHYHGKSHSKHSHSSSLNKSKHFETGLNEEYKLSSKLTKLT